MKRLFLLGALAFLGACNSNDSAKSSSGETGSDSTGVAATINSPYEIMYSSKFAEDAPKNAESLLTLWKDFDNGDLMAHKDLIADTFEMHLSDGTYFKGPRDSALAFVQGYRNTLASAVSSVNAITALKSTDKDENWALIWGKEVDVFKKGGKDSSYLQETWRFNKDGKANLFFQFRQAGSPPKK